MLVYNIQSKATNLKRSESLNVKVKFTSHAFSVDTDKRWRSTRRELNLNRMTFRNLLPFSGLLLIQLSVAQFIYARTRDLFNSPTKRHHIFKRQTPSVDFDFLASLDTNELKEVQNSQHKLLCSEMPTQVLKVSNTRSFGNDLGTAGGPNLPYFQQQDIKRIKKRIVCVIETNKYIR